MPEFVVEHLDPKSLQPHNRNPRKHTARQREAYRALRDSLDPGAQWLQSPIYNRQTGRLLDGHMRVDEAIRAGETAIPVRVLDIPESQELLILEHLDSISTLATVDPKAQAELTKSNLENISKKHKRILNNLSTSYQAAIHKVLVPPVHTHQSRQIEKPEPTPTPSTPQDAVQLSINNDAIFPSDNEWGIPNLLKWHRPNPLTVPDRIYTRTEPPTPTTYFCQSTRPFRDKTDGGILGFYTEDWRFEHIYRDGAAFANILLQESWGGIIAPDFSTYHTWPLPLQLYNVYRSRWCARLWQELDLPVIPSIQDLGDPEHTQSIVLDTIPPKYPIVSLQTRKTSAHTNRDYTDLLRLIHAIHATIQPKYIILYGGAVVEKYIAGSVDTPRTKLIYLPHFIQQRRKHLDGR